MQKPLEFGGTFRGFKLDWTGRGTWSPIVWIHWFSSGWRCSHILELVRPVGLVGHPPRSVSLQQQFLHHSQVFTITIHSHQLLHKPQNASPCTLGSGCCCQLVLLPTIIHVQIHMGRKRQCFKADCFGWNQEGSGKVGRAVVCTDGMVRSSAVFGSWQQVWPAQCLTTGPGLHHHDH